MAKQQKKKTTALAPRVELPLAPEAQGPKAGEANTPPQEAKTPRRCGGCRHYLALEEANGFCRRYPPTINSLVLTSNGPYGIFPITLFTNLCGEFSPPLPADDASQQLPPVS